MADTEVAVDDENFTELARRAREAGLIYREIDWTAYTGNTYRHAEIEFPRGNATRSIRLLDQTDVIDLLKVDFENVRFSSKYDAMFHTQTGRVECGLTWAPVLSRRPGSGALWDIPGTEIDEDSPLKTGAESPGYGIPNGWRVKVATDEVEIELSPASQSWTVLNGRYAPTSSVTLKIQHTGGADGPRAHVLLDSFGQDFMLEVELKYQLGLGLATDLVHGLVPETDITQSTTPVTFPSLSFQAEAATFYWYGVRAYEFPLLQFLAFYQVLEYFFMPFTRASVVRRVRAQLKDPAFDRGRDTDIAALIGVTGIAHAGLRQESEQLKLALAECIEPASLRTFITANEDRESHFVGSQKIAGVRPLRITVGDQELLDQVAERIYKVRNRIVHTKSAADEAGIELLLPTSEETRFLRTEVELGRWLAQRALIHGATLRSP